MPGSKSIRLVLLSMAVIALVGCGTPEVSGLSKSATIRASVRSDPEFTGDDQTETGATRRRIELEVHPHCVDGSRTLDCEGIYTFVMTYRVREKTQSGLRCGDVVASIFRYVAPGEVQAAVTGEPAGMRPVCGQGDPSYADAVSASPEIVTEGILPMSDVTKPNQPDGPDRPAIFQATMRLTVAPSGTAEYEWRGRDGARCAGTLGAEQAGRQPECTWR